MNKHDYKLSTSELILTLKKISMIANYGIPSIII